MTEDLTIPSSQAGQLPESQPTQPPGHLSLFDELRVLCQKVGGLDATSEKWGAIRAVYSLLYQAVRYAEEAGL